MTVKHLLILVLFVFSSSFCQSQDAAAQKLRFQIGFESISEQHLLNDQALVNMPLVIRRTRQFTTSLPVSFDTVSDLPYRHGAMYMAAKTTTRLRNKLTLKADLYAEYRGMSYGTYNKNNLVFYPVIEISGRDTLQIGKTEWIVEGKAGQLLDEKLDEGLTIYNIDLQGWQLGVRYKNGQLTYSLYADLVGAIGLNTDDVRSLSYVHYINNDSNRIGVSWVTGMPPGWEAIAHSYFNLYGSTILMKNLRVFAQIGYKISPAGYDRFFGSCCKMAMVAGVETEYTHRKLYVITRAAVRYYGRHYNIHHHEYGFKYRDSAQDVYGMYANSTGEYIYPLRKFYTPFSQWAVFTEYQGYNVWGVTAEGTCKYVGKKAGLGFDYDINLIWGRLGKQYYYNTGESRNTSFLFPFFKAWASYLPLKECALSVFLSNKTMNLDVSYPTHYLLKRPFVGFDLHVKI